ncbi:F-box and associated interaction domain protein, putative [Medicago truncatula]|uniref:F-box and associated interaction domain protein, putative n=1 Tax=Medicago truncatula TaxID=3880 RepID=G7IXV4_MEDTR|nr:F-box and associated interaction domain protein, putative [Medicago truncatula]
MAPTNEEKVGSNYIPNEIVFFILSNLPVKSIKRFSCARKLWSLLFENPNFINMFCENLISKSHRLYDNACLILNQIDVPPPFHIQRNGVTLICILDSAINGTLCIYNCYNHTEAILLNPTTEEIKVIL